MKTTDSYMRELLAKQIAEEWVENKAHYTANFPYKKLLEVARRMSLIPYTTENYYGLFSDDRPEFFGGCTTWGDALNRFENPDYKWIKSIRKALKQSYTEIGEKPVYQPSMQGEVFNVSAFIGGDPECFLTKVKAKKEIRKVSLKVNIGYSYKVKADSLLKNMGFILAHIKRLEEQNFQVKLILVLNGRLKNSTYSYAIPVKKHGERIDIAKVVAILQPSTSRFILHKFVAMVHPDITKGLAGVIFEDDVINLGSNWEDIENVLSKVFI